MKHSPNIVLCSIGDYRIPEWIVNRGNYDVCLIYYGNSTKRRELLENYSTYFIHQNGFKMPNYLAALNSFSLVEKYNQFTFIDDDLEITTDVVNRCFSRLDSYNLDACQPSEVSLFQFWRLMKRRNGVFMDYTNFIECKCMCLSNSVVKKMLDYWDIFHTGFGFDLVLRDTFTKFAVFHDIYFFHRVFKPKKYQQIRNEGETIMCTEVVEKLKKLFQKNIWIPEPTILNTVPFDADKHDRYLKTLLRHRFILFIEQYFLLFWRKKELKPYKGAYKELPYIQKL